MLEFLVKVSILNCSFQNVAQFPKIFQRRSTVSKLESISLCKNQNSAFKIAPPKILAIIDVNAYALLAQL